MVNTAKTILLNLGFSEDDFDELTVFLEVSLQSCPNQYYNFNKTLKRMF